MTLNLRYSSVCLLLAGLTYTIMGAVPPRPVEAIPDMQVVKGVAILNEKSREMSGETYTLVAIALSPEYYLHKNMDAAGWDMYSNFYQSLAPTMESEIPPGKYREGVVFRWVRIPKTGNLELTAAYMGEAPPYSQDERQQFFKNLGFKAFTIPVDAIPKISAQKAEDVLSQMEKLFPATRPSSAPATASQPTSSNPSSTSPASKP